MNFLLTNAIGLCICWVGMDMFDHILSTTSSRWNCAGAFGSLIISLFSFEGALKLMTDSFNSMNTVLYPETLFGPSSKIPLWVAIVMQAYHVFTFENVSKGDFTKHCIFIGVCGISGMYYEWGLLKNYLLFFSYGLPDFIYHCSSICTKNKSISLKKHLRINCKINSWIRNTCMNAGFCIHFILFTQHSTDIPYLIHIILSVCLLYMNTLVNEGFIGRYYESANIEKD